MYYLEEDFQEEALYYYQKLYCLKLFIIMVHKDWAYMVMSPGKMSKSSFFISV